MDAKKIIKEILKEKGKITDVYFVACGGSLVDLYPVCYFVQSESKTVHSMYYTSKEFVVSAPKNLTKNSITIVCSHSGNTPEAIEAAKLAKSIGSYVIVFTNNEKAKINSDSFKVIVYPWGDNISVQDEPMGESYALMNELLKFQEDYAGYEKMKDGLSKIDSIIKRSVEVEKESAVNFADKYSKEPFLYIVGSGASFSQAYGFSICSLMEMQWINCCYIHSAEFFHGPFEVLDKDVLYILLMNEGRTRVMDERVLKFLKKYGSKYTAIDTRNFGIDSIDKDVVDYFNPFVFYKMACLYREELAKVKGHPTSVRRYMGVVEY